MPITPTTPTIRPPHDPGRPLALLRLVRHALADTPGIGAACLPDGPDQSRMAVFVTVAAHRVDTVTRLLGAMGLTVDPHGARRLAVTVGSPDPTDRAADAAAMDAVDLVRQLGAMGCWTDRGPVVPARWDQSAVLVIDGQHLSPSWRALPAGAHLWDTADTTVSGDVDVTTDYALMLDVATDALGLSWDDGCLWLTAPDADADAGPSEPPAVDHDAPHSRAPLRGTPGPLTGPDADARMAAGIATAAQLRARWGRPAIVSAYWQVGHADQPAPAPDADPYATPSGADQRDGRRATPHVIDGVTYWTTRGIDSADVAAAVAYVAQLGAAPGHPAALVSLDDDDAHAHGLGAWALDTLVIDAGRLLAIVATVGGPWGGGVMLTRDHVTDAQAAGLARAVDHWIGALSDVLAGLADDQLDAPCASCHGTGVAR